MPNVADRLRASASRLPDKAALLGGRKQVTYSELNARADAVAAGFQALGLAKGDRVALLLPNAASFVEALYGALRAGLVVVPLNVGFTAQEVGQILADAGASAVVTDEAFRGLLEGVRETIVGLDHVIVTGTPISPMGARTWRQFLSLGRDAPAAVDVGDDDLALLPYTAGTTGRPKGAMLSHGNLLANQDQIAATRQAVSEVDIVVCVLPLFHIYSLNVALAFPLSRGATVLLLERFDPIGSLETIATLRASVIVGVPPMYIAWLNTPGLEGYDLGSVRFAVSGAAALPRAVLDRFTDELGVRIWEGYGLTETSPVLTTTAMSDASLAGSVGRPVPGVELRIVTETGADAPDGDPGEVVVRGPNVFSGYWQDAVATKVAIDADGWFHTGDVGLIDDGGDLLLVDRKKDLIIVSGFNVYPREVEEVLYRHPAVSEAAVVGVAHPYTGEAVKAVVVLEGGRETSADEITNYCRRFLARFKCPDIVEFAEALPHNAAGKVLRRELR